MRLWHEALLPVLPNHQLLGQHRECCALRGKGWGRNHSTVNYVFQHPLEWLWAYHVKVMNVMTSRGYSHDPLWDPPRYRGKKLGRMDGPLIHYDGAVVCLRYHFPVYQEHDDDYLRECLDNLKRKGIEITL